MIASPPTVRAKIEELFDGLLRHDGWGEMRIELRLLPRGRREVILHCGRQYRYVVETRAAEVPAAEA